MRMKKIIIGTIMTLVVGICTIAENTLISYGMEQIITQKIDKYTSSESGNAEEAEVTGDAAKIASLHNPIIDVSTQSVAFSYVYFGSYPQSEVTGEALTQDIVNAEYVSGDAVVAGKKYCRVITEKGQQYYFKYEPIKWRVINVEDNKAVLWSDKILDYKPYNTEYQVAWNESGRWNGTTLQYWLNGYGTYSNGFLQQAFTEKEVEGILDTEIKDHIYNVNRFITDKVFLLALGEFDFEYETEQIWLTEKSTYANFLSPNKQNIYGAWWLRNNAYTEYEGYVDYIDEKGEVHVRFPYDFREDVLDNENVQASARNTDIGVCPAITLDLTNTKLWKTEDEWKRLQLYSVGDVNWDGKITLEDAQIVLKAALKIIMLEDDKVAYADVDEDEEVSLTDAQMILKKALKIH